MLRKNSITCVYKTHTMYQIQIHTKLNGTESCVRSQPLFLVELRMDDFSVIGGLRLDAQTLVVLLLLLLLLLLLAPKSPCLLHCPLLLGWQRLIPSENRPRWFGKMGYQFHVDKHCPYPLQDLPNRTQCFLDRIAPIPSRRYFVLQHWRVLILSFQMFHVGFELLELEASDCLKVLVFGTTTKTRLPREFPRS